MSKNIFSRISGLIHKNRYALLFAGLLIIYIFNMLLDVMELDAAQYANISMEMSYNKSFLEVYYRGNDYLDKPPLLFWLSSLSFILFGIGNFTYKLPSVIILLLGVYSTYRFALMWYSKDISRLAALIFASTQAVFLITNDVRTDINLVGLVIFSTWQISLYIREHKWRNLILGAIGTGGAMLAKGPIGIVIPALAIGGDLLLKQDWRAIFKYQWLIFLGIVALVLLPMSYGLYVQFDLHPEKFVYEMQGPSGLKFFYWTQSFGRITGDSYWENDASFFFFFHTILWDMQPWVLLFIPALILRFVQLVREKFKPSGHEEYISLAGFILVFLALSKSNFKLPHYIFPIFPFAAVMTANFIYSLKDNLIGKISRWYLGILQLFWVMVLIMFIFVFPPSNIVAPGIALLIFLLSWYIFSQLKPGVEKLVIPILVTAIGFNFVLSTHFYPNLLSFQASAKAGKLVYELKIPEDRFFCYYTHENVLDFYSKRTNTALKFSELEHLPSGTWVFTDNKGYEHFIDKKLSFKSVHTFPYQGPTILRINFLNRKTRESALKYYHIMEKI
jgi:4-amino-4-deoxy-L-arabinose transferase-like glycosyltransferase